MFTCECCNRQLWSASVQLTRKDQWGDDEPFVVCAGCAVEMDPDKWGTNGITGEPFIEV